MKIKKILARLYDALTYACAMDAGLTYLESRGEASRYLRDVSATERLRLANMVENGAIVRYCGDTGFYVEMLAHDMHALISALNGLPESNLHVQGWNE